MARGATWTNSDGLVVGFGKHTEDNNVSGEFGGSGVTKTITMLITGADLPDTFAAANRDPQEHIIKRGSIITRATFQVITAFTSGGAATLDIGTWGTNDTVDDADGLVADMTIAELTSIGEVHVLDGALINASGQTAVGATAAADCVLAPSYETAVFTAGTGLLTVEYQQPTASTGGTIAAA